MSSEEVRLADFRRVFAQMVCARGSCRDPRIREAFETVPRHRFCGAGPWYVSEHGDVTPTADPALVYQDIGMALAMERGITTGLPSLHARCIEACAPQPGERVIQIGTGAGYFTAIFAHLVGERGSVLGFEIDEMLAAQASELLGDRSNVRIESRSGVSKLEQADVIYACAGLQQLPLGWLDALAPGGRLVFPLTPGTEEGGMLLVTAEAAGFAARFICRARFVPCIGALDAARNAELAGAFRMGTHETVRSLRRSSPDETSWYAGDRWWLSTRPITPAES